LPVCVIQDLRETILRHDAADNLTEQIAGITPEGSPFQQHLSWTTFAYDAANRRTAMTEGIARPVDKRVTFWNYDGNGNVLLVRQASEVYWFTSEEHRDIEYFRQTKATSYGYDPFNRRIEMVDGYVRPNLDPNDTLPGGPGEIGFPLGHASPRTLYDYD